MNIGIIFCLWVRLSFRVPDFSPVRGAGSIVRVHNRIPGIFIYYILILSDRLLRMLPLSSPGFAIYSEKRDRTRSASKNASLIMIDKVQDQELSGCSEVCSLPTLEL